MILYNIILNYIHIEHVKRLCTAILPATGSQTKILRAEIPGASPVWCDFATSR